MSQTTDAVKKSGWFKRLFRLGLKCTAWFIGISVMWVLLLKWVNPPFNFLMIQQAIVNEGSQQREWVRYDDISFYMKLAVVSSEDQNFMKHYGIDFGAIKKAMKYNEKNKGKKVRGASTISQQVAKNVFLWPGRSYVRKAFEVWFTLLIETFWSKERILEVYLNIAETGVNTFGVQAAAQKYYKKDAINLNREQAAMITASIPSPRKSNPAKPSAYLKKRQQHVFRQMRFMGNDYFIRYGGDTAPPGKQKSKKKESKE